MHLIRRYLQAGVLINGVVMASDEGTPQGGPLSPLLANIMLDDLDRFLTERGHKFCRYGDDCNIYVGSQRAGERVMAGSCRFLSIGRATGNFLAIVSFADSESNFESRRNR